MTTTETLLKRTTSRCPVCHAAAPAEVLRRSEGGKQTVWLRRRCAEHGAAEACISSDARFYWLAQGDPTLHPQFFELLAWCHAHPGLDYVLLNTNGVRIATDDDFADQLGKTFRTGKFQLYLQFDGPQEAGQRTLRGADLRAIREKAI